MSDAYVDFLSLPEDILDYLWGFYDPYTLASISSMNKWALERSKTAKGDFVWERHCRHLIDFNTYILRDEPDLLFATKEEEIRERKHSRPIERKVGFEKMVELAKNRFQALSNSGALKPFNEFLTTLSFEEHFSSSVLARTRRALPTTWRAIYVALEAFMDEKRCRDYPRDREASGSILCHFTRKGKAQMASVAIQALLTDRASYWLNGTNVKKCDASVVPFLWEWMVLQYSSFHDQFVGQLLKRSLDPHAILCVVDDIFDDFDIRNRNKAGLDAESVEFMSAFGLERTFTTLLELFGISDVSGAFEDRLKAVVYSEDREKVPEKIRAFCVHLLSLNGSTDAIVDIMLKLEDNLPLIEEAVVRTLQDVSSQTSRLVSIVQDAEMPPRGRIRASLILHRSGYDIRPLNVLELGIPGLPRPWTAAAELPSGVRKAILRQYAKKAERGSDLALLVEAALIEEKPVDPLPEEDDYRGRGRGDSPPECVFGRKITVLPNGMELRGPVSATDFHGGGGGTFTVSEILVDPFDSDDYDSRPDSLLLSVCLLFECKFAPYAAVERVDNYVKNYDFLPHYDEETLRQYEEDAEAQALPTFDDAVDALLRVADAEDFQILEDDLLQTLFDGLNVYCFGRRNPLSIRSLLFYWQD